jgi:hypothetical protein
MIYKYYRSRKATQLGAIPRPSATPTCSSPALFGVGGSIHPCAPFVPKVAAGLLNTARHPKEAYDPASIINVNRRSLEGAWGIDRGEDAFVHQNTMGRSRGILVGTHHLATVVDVEGEGSQAPGNSIGVRTPSSSRKCVTAPAASTKPPIIWPRLLMSKSAVSAVAFGTSIAFRRACMVPSS